MSSNFPLYDTLLKGTKNKPLTQQQKNKLALQINSMEIKGTELVYALIRMHCVSSNDVLDGNKMYGVELNESYAKNDISFDLDIFPNRLLQILLKFTALNVDHEKETASKEKANKGGLRKQAPHTNELEK